MVQSVELLLDEDAEAAVVAEWDLLADAGLPSSRRAEPSPSHRPHVTLLASGSLSDVAERELSRVVAGLELSVRIGAPMLFLRRPGRRDRDGGPTVVLVRQLVATSELLRLQQAVFEVAGPGLGTDFQPGCWSPHVTLARRCRPEQAGAAVDLLARRPRSAEGPVLITRARRWDGEAKRDWLL